MPRSIELRPAAILGQMSAAARARYATEAKWAEAAGVPKETLCRLKNKSSCDLSTLWALALAAGYKLVAVPAAAGARDGFPERFDRRDEDELLDLVASGNVDPVAWRAYGSGFSMGGLAVMLASSRDFDRERYLRLAESLHPGISTPEAFATWLKKSPLRASRFLPMARRRGRFR